MSLRRPNGRLPRLPSILAAALLVSAACDDSSGRRIDDAQVVDRGQGQDWLAFGRTFDEQRFSPLADVVGWGGSIPGLGGSIGAQHGWSYRAQPRKLVAFAVGGDAELPPSPPPFFPEPIVDESFEIHPVLVGAGQETYVRVCWLCHGAAAVGSGKAPDLRASPVVVDRDAFVEVVFNGGLLENGMPIFTTLSEIEAEGVRHYVRSRAHAAREEGTP